MNKKIVLITLSVIFIFGGLKEVRSQNIGESFGICINEYGVGFSNEVTFSYERLDLGLRYTIGINNISHITSCINIGYYIIETPLWADNYQLAMDFGAGISINKLYGSYYDIQPYSWDFGVQLKNVYWFTDKIGIYNITGYYRAEGFVCNFGAIYHIGRN